MYINQLEDDSDSSGEVIPERVLSDWTEAITNLYKNYSKLSSYIHKTSEQHDPCKNRTIYIGQCPTSQLVTLVASMQMELENLLNDISQVSEQLTAEQNYRKLITHTSRLNQLNQLAQSRLQLLSLSSS